MGRGGVDSTREKVLGIFFFAEPSHAYFKVLHCRGLPTRLRTKASSPSALNTSVTCRQIHLTRHFSHAVCPIHFMHITLHGSSVCMRASFHLHAIHDERLIVRSLSVSSCLSVSCFLSVVYTFSSLSYLHSFFHVNSAKGNSRCAFAQ